MVTKNAAKSSREHLCRALTAAGSDTSLGEVKQLIYRAIHKIDEVDKKAPKKPEAFWSSVVAGVGQAKFSPEAAMKNLEQLNKLVGVEQKKIDEIEQAVGQTQDGLLTD